MEITKTNEVIDNLLSILEFEVFEHTDEQMVCDLFEAMLKVYPDSGKHFMVGKVGKYAYIATPKDLETLNNVYDKKVLRWGVLGVSLGFLTVLTGFTAFPQWVHSATAIVLDTPNGRELEFSLAPIIVVVLLFPVVKLLLDRL
jgi:hypothetical protein